MLDWLVHPDWFKLYNESKVFIFLLLNCVFLVGFVFGAPYQTANATIFHSYQLKLC